MSDIEKAKEIFRSHACSHFILYKDSQSILDEYWSYNIDKNTELEWTREYILDVFKDLNTKNIITKLYSLYNCGIHRFNDLMIEMCDKIEKIYLDIDDNEIDKTIILLKIFQMMGKSNDVDVVKKARILMLKILLTINESNLDRLSLSRYIDIKHELM